MRQEERFPRMQVEYASDRLRIKRPGRGGGGVLLRLPGAQDTGDRGRPLRKGQAEAQRRPASGLTRCRGIVQAPRAVGPAGGLRLTPGPAMVVRREPRILVHGAGKKTETQG